MAKPPTIPFDDRVLKNRAAEQLVRGPNGLAWAVLFSLMNFVNLHRNSLGPAMAGVTSEAVKMTRLALELHAPEVLAMGERAGETVEEADA